MTKPLMMELRGLRNHNPGNIDYSPANQWQGLDPTRPSDGRFCRFLSPEWGIRAMARLLRNYRRHPGQPGVGGSGIDTVTEVIHRWAPPNENNTAAYVDQVARALRVGRDTPIDLGDREVLAPLIEAIIRHENGLQPYSRELILAGVDMA